MAGKGGKGGGTSQPAFRGGGTLSGMLGQGGGFGGGGGGSFMDMLRGQFQPQQFAPVPPPMQTPGQQFTPFNGQPMPTDFGRQQPPPTGGPTPGQSVPATPQTVGGLGQFNMPPISPIGFLPDGTIGHLPPTQSQPGQPQQFAPAPPPMPADFGRQQPPGVQQFNGPMMNSRVAPAVSPPSPLGPLVSPKGGLRPGAF